MTTLDLGSRPSPELVRRATDRQLFEQLLGADALTRAELAERTGISKPTVSEAVRRLAEAGVLAEAGRQSGKRGPAGRYFRLHGGLGVALAVAAGRDGVVVETYAVDGTRLRRVERPVPADVDAVRLGPVLTEALRAARDEHSAPVLGCAVSVAGPVHAGSGAPVRMPHAPFPVKGFRPRALVAAVTGSDVVVDNDVNWMALAEQSAGAAQGLRDFVLCYLGAGVGSAVVLNGELVRGSRGFAGELAYVATTGPDGRSRTVVEVLSELGLIRPRVETVDVEAMQELLTRTDPDGRNRGALVTGAVAGALASVCAVLDPAAVLVGGPWGSAGDFAERVARQVETRLVVPVPLRRTALDGGAVLTGASLAAIRAARAAVVAAL